MMKKHLILIFLLTMLACGIAAARDDNVVIQIIGGQESAIPIAVVPFAWNADGPPPATPLHEVISNDLNRSGYFRTLAQEDVIETPFRAADVKFGTWRRLNVDYLLIGQVLGDVEQGYQVRATLLEVANQDRLFTIGFNAKPGSFRYTAHHVADTVFENIVDKPGVFRTRLAYVTSEPVAGGIRYSLMVADADGYNPQAVVRSQEPLLSPSWSPDGRQLGYVSFERGNSAVYVQDVATGKRELLASFKGINGAPSFSPDGTRLALTLSRSGNPEIYVMDLASRRLTQLTNHWAIDTEPTWDASGSEVFFTSDRGGKPQIYKVSARGGGKPERVTRDGEYNARASIAPDGSMLALVNGSGNDYKIGVIDLEDKRLRLVSNGPLDESPSFAPNGTMILYASRNGSQGVLSAVPIFGAGASGPTAHQLVFAQGDIREPAWSPIRR